jgi:Tfp pilus assembly protein PilV
MNRPPNLRRPRVLRRAQRGISLLFSLMAMVILGFGAIALTRSIDTGTLIMGNLALKQDTLSSSATGTEQAIAWLQATITAGASTLDTTNPDFGYYANAIDKLDPTGNHSTSSNKLPLVNWDGDCMGRASSTYQTCDTLPFTGTDVNGNKVQWVITRLCDAAGAPSGTNLCVRPAAAPLRPPTTKAS